MDLLPVKIDVKLQAVLDLRSELIDLVRTINDPSQLERLIGVAKESTQPERGR
ncbi:hypothetical protein ALO80_200030 [Pseudomonas caricapapayae]|nr:hypothetical protein ALO80_200030 [Pseudomonas caricapapayae]RMV76142.1 hypothetical protein ALP04_200022 [Pseudomonas amygdali pv. sesami]